MVVVRSKMSLREVVGAVERVSGRRGRRGRRGARLSDIVECVVERVHARAVGRALRGLVRTGALRRRGRRYRLASGLAPRRRQHRSRKGRAGRVVGRRRRRRRRSTGSLVHLTQPRSCYTLVDSNPSRTSSTCSTDCRRNRSSSGETELTVNGRLARTRDSVEMLKERLSSKSTQTRGSSDQTVAASSHYWLNQRAIQSSVDTLPNQPTHSSVDTLPNQPTHSSVDTLTHSHDGDGKRVHFPFTLWH